MTMEKHGGKMLTGENSWFIHHSALWQYYQQSHLVANQEELGEGNDGIRDISGSQDSDYEDDNLLGYSAV
jgi:hypothetical protein